MRQSEDKLNSFSFGVLFEIYLPRGEHIITFVCDFLLESISSWNLNVESLVVYYSPAVKYAVVDEIGPQLVVGVECEFLTGIAVVLGKFDFLVMLGIGRSDVRVLPDDEGSDGEYG